MKVVEVGPPYTLSSITLAERSDRTGPGNGEIVVRVRAVALNYRDLLVARGEGRWRPPAGRIPASDAVGEVVAVGADVTRVALGDRVITAFMPRWIDGPLTEAKLPGALGGAGTDGVLAEYVTLDAAAVVHAPEHLSDVEAATLPCAGVTAWQALTRANSLSAGTTLLVQGTGGVSLFALQFAAAAGARVIVTSRSDDKLDRAMKIGASAGINTTRDIEWDHAALELTGGIGADHVIDIGGADTLGRSLAAVRWEGVVSVVGLIGGLQAAIDLTPIFLKNIRIDGIETGSREMLHAAVRWTERHRIHPVVDRVFEMDEAPAAFAYLASGTHMGKVCIAL